VETPRKFITAKLSHIISTDEDIVREHLEDTLRICDVSAMGLFTETRSVYIGE
jgi:hypothetical protein